MKQLLGDAMDRPREDRERFVREHAHDSDEADRVLELVAALDEGEGFMEAATLASPGDSQATPQSPASNIATPNMDRYRMLDRIGDGGFGSVYLAEQLEPVRRRVAVKVNRTGLDDGDVLARFNQERQALALMDHPGIARVFDAGVTSDGRPFFAMEFVDGEPITTYCSSRSLTLAAKLSIVQDLCLAVQHAHQKGVIHRDLKPSNVLITELDGHAMPKVIDFGIAKAIETRLGDHTIVTERRTLIGTPEYMSPEQADPARGGIDTRSDVYALGVLLYELVVGATPLSREQIRGASIAQIIQAVQHQEPPRPSTRLLAQHPDTTTERIRGELDWIIMRALAKEPDRRYQTALALAEDLGRFLRDEPIQARPPSRLYRVRKFTRRHRAATAAMLVAGIAIVSGIAMLAYGLAEASRERRVAEENLAAAKTEREAALASLAETKSVTDFLMAAISSVHPLEKGLDLRVVDLLDQALADLESRGLSASSEARLRETIGLAYESLGNLDAAESLLRQALALQESRGQEGRPYVLVLRNNLAYLAARRGDIPAALAMSEELLPLMRQEFGNDHPVTIDAMHSYAIRLERVGRLQEAEALFAQLVDAQTRVRGAEHPLTLTTRRNYATAVGAAGDIPRAVRLLEDLIEICGRNFGPEDYRTATMNAGLAEMLSNAGEHQRAADIWRSVHHTLERTLGPAQADTLGARLNWSLALDRAGDTDAAWTELPAILQHIPNDLPRDHHLALLTAFATARILVRGRGNPAPELIQSCIDIARSADRTASFDAEDAISLARLLADPPASLPADCTLASEWAEIAIIASDRLDPARQAPFWLDVAIVRAGCGDRAAARHAAEQASDRSAELDPEQNETLRQLFEELREHTP